MFRSVLVASVATFFTLAVASPALAVNFTSSQITSPADNSVSIYDNANPNTLHVEGTTAGGDSNADLVCFYGPTGRRVLATNVAVTAGAFSTDVSSISFDSFTNVAAKPYCQLRAVPTGDTTVYPPIGANDFAGPRIMTGRIDTYKVGGGGPNQSLVTDFFAGVGQKEGYTDYLSLGGCGLDWSFVFDPITLEQSSALFYCNSWTHNRNGCGAATATCTAGTQSDITVDGKNAYAPSTATGLYYIDPSHNSEGLPGLPELTFTRSIDPLNGDIHLAETDPIVNCSPNETAYHGVGSNAAWPTDCSSFAGTGIKLDRTITTDQNGRRSRFVDVWSNTDSVSHNLEVLYDEEFAGDAGTNPSPSFAYSWIDPSSFAVPNLGETIQGPGGSAPGTVLIDGNAGSADAFKFPQGAVTMSPAPSSIHWYSRAPRLQYGNFRYTQTIPAGGTFKVMHTFIDGGSKAEIAALAGSESDRFGTPTVAITSPADGTSSDNPAVTVTGTATDPGGAVSSLTVNGDAVMVAGDGTWSKALTLRPGENSIKAVASDATGNSGSASAKVTYTPKPVVVVPVQVPADKTPPTLGLVIAKTKLATLLKKGLPVTVSSSEPCTFSIALVIDSTTAKKLHLSRVVTVGRASGALTTAGKQKVVVKLTKKAKKALKKATSVAITVKTTAKDTAGNSAAKSKKVTIKRR